MNKCKMGAFLRKLREEKKLSQSDLAEEFSKDYLDVSVNAISSWEKGKSIPDIDKLNFLASYYQVTVDEILDGSFYQEVDFNQIYKIHTREYFVAAEAARRYQGDEPYYKEIIDYVLMIRKRFKTLVLSFIIDEVTRSETKELSFLLKNYFILDESMNVTSYFAFLRSLKRDFKSTDERWWEAQKYVRPIAIIRLNFGNVSDGHYKFKDNQRLIESCEDWEKDLLLATIQVSDPVFLDPIRFPPVDPKKYLKENGKPLTKESITKDTIRYLIQNGAKLNKQFLGYLKGRKETTRMIDSLQSCYEKIDRPISICVKKDNKRKVYWVENTRKNRTLIHNDYNLVKPLRKIGFNEDEIYQMVISNKEIPDFVFKKAALSLGMNADQDINELKREIYKTNLDFYVLESYWKECFTNDSNLMLEEEKLKVMKKRLKEGLLLNTNMVMEFIGGKNPFERSDFVFNKKEMLSLKDFNESRDNELTQELLNSLDKMNMSEIHARFFNGGIEL